MIEIQQIRTDKDRIIQQLKKRSVDYSGAIEEVLTLDNQWRMLKTELDQCAHDGNKLAKEIGALYQRGAANEANVLKEKTTLLKGKENDLKEQVEALERQLKNLLYTIPNVPNTVVKEGKNAEEENDH